MKLTEKPSSERALIEAFADGVRDILPAGWNVEELVEPMLGCLRPDALIELIAPDGQRARVVVEAKMTLEPRNVGTALEQVNAFAELTPESELTPIILARFLSPRVRQMLTEQRVSWADATGNMWLSVDRPAVFVQRLGAAVDPWAERKPLRSLRGSGAAATVRALCDFVPPYSVSELARRAGLPIASVFRTVEFLTDQALIDKQAQRGQIASVDWASLLARWSEDYSLLGSNRTVLSCIDPRGTNALLSRLESVDEAYVLTASAVAELIAPVAPTRLVAIYTKSPTRLAEKLGLPPVESGANAMLIEPFAPVQMDRAIERNGLRCAALSQVVVDLLTSPGRGPAEGEALLEWMKGNEGEWRV